MTRFRFDVYVKKEEIEVEAETLEEAEHMAVEKVNEIFLDPNQEISLEAYEYFEDENGEWYPVLSM